jgi:CheY-like chemotaxis protein
MFGGLAVARVLIVDDDDVVRALIVAVLETLKHEATEVRTGVEAIRAHQQNPFDLIITDIYMPDMDGLELIRTFARSANKPPIIAISGGGSVTRMDPLPAAERFGASAIIYKPVDLMALEELVTTLLARVRSARR